MRKKRKPRLLWFPHRQRRRIYICFLEGILFVVLQNGQSLDGMKEKGERFSLSREELGAGKIVGKFFVLCFFDRKRVPAGGCVYFGKFLDSSWGSWATKRATGCCPDE